MKILSKLLLLSIIFHSYAFANSTINCLTPKTARKYRTLCKNVIDPMKFKSGEMRTLNCTEDLGDGYDVGICEQVNINEQHRMKQGAFKK